MLFLSLTVSLLPGRLDPATFIPGREPLVPTGQEAGWAPEQVLVL